MIYAITRYEKKQIAKLNTEELTHAIALHTDRLQENCAKAVKAWKDAPFDQKQTALQRIDDANKKLDDYIDEQRAIFKAKGLNADRAFKEAIIATGETNANGVEVFRIVKREKPITPFDDEVDKVLAEDERMMSDVPDYDTDEDWDSDVWY